MDGILTREDVKAIKAGYEFIAYHGEKYFSLRCTNNTGVLIVKYGEHTETRILLPSTVHVYEENNDFDAKYYACSHSQRLSYEYNSALAAFQAFVRVGDRVALHWHRSTANHRDVKGTKYEGMMHDRINLEVQRKDNYYVFPLNDNVSFDELARLVNKV